MIRARTSTERRALAWVNGEQVNPPRRIHKKRRGEWLKLGALYAVILAAMVAGLVKFGALAFNALDYEIHHTTTTAEQWAEMWNE